MPISQILPDGNVQIFNSNTKEQKVVAPEDLSSYNPELVAQYKQMKVQTPAPQSPVDPSTQPNLAPDTTAQPQDLTSKIGQGIIDVGTTMAKPFIRTAKTIGGSGYELYRLGKKSLGDINAYVDQKTGQRVENPFLNKDELNNFSQPMEKQLQKGGALRQQLADSLNVASYAIPFSKEAGLIKGALIPGAAVGAAQKISEAGNRDVTPSEVVGSAALGAGTGALLHGLGIVKGALTSGGEKVAAEGEAVTQGIRQIKVKPTVGGAQQEKAINQTLDDLGIRGTPQQQYEQLQPVMEDLTGKINEHLDASTASEPIRPLVSTLETNIQNTTNFDSAIPGYQKWNDHFIGQVKQAANEDGIVRAKDLFALKQKIADQIPNAFEKDAMGTIALTPKEEMGLATWHNIDDLITKIDPTVKDLTTQQSQLYQSAKSLSSARSNPPTLRAAGFSIPARATITAQRAGGAVLEKTGNAMSAVGNVMPNVPAVSGQIASRLGSLSGGASQSIDQGGQEPQGTTQGQTTQDNSYNPQKTIQDHTIPSIGNTSGDIVSQNDGTSGLGEKPPTLNPYGATPQVIYREYQNALQAGDTKTATRLRAMFTDEMAYQKSTAAKSPKYSEFDKKMVFAGDEVKRAYDAFVLNESKIPVGPGSGISKSVGRIFGNAESPEASTFYSQLALAKTAVQSALLGANKSPQEIKDFMDANFSSDLPASKLKNNMKAFIGSIDAYKKSIAGPEVAQPSGLGETPPALSE